jgi:hypothetical protein
MSSTTLRPRDPAAAGAPGVLAEASRLVGELREVLWAARNAGEKAETVAAIEVLKSTLHALELDVVRDLEATHAVQHLGWASTADFVTAVTGGHKGTGPATVRLAIALDAPLLTPVADALADGWLSATKTQLIERTIDDLPLDREVRARGVQVLLDEAKRLDATDLRKAARRLVEVVDPEGDARREEQALAREERGAHLDRALSITDDGAGGARIRGRCSAEDAALIRSTLLPLAKPRPSSVPDCDPATCEVPGCGHDGRDPRDHGARMLDALAEACRLLQTAKVLPESHGVGARVTITIGLDALKNGTGFATTDTGEDLSAESLRKMACDAEIIPSVLDAEGAVLDVGRAIRLVTAAIWYALIIRDKHCRFSGCTRPPVMCHAHHIQHWVDGGPTSLADLVLLCGHHHRLVHAGPWTVEQPKPGLFTFAPPDAVRRARGPRPDRAPPEW